MRIKLYFILTLIFSLYSPMTLAQNQNLQLPCKANSEKMMGESNTNLPGIWWAAEQFDPFDGKLIEGWSINTENQSIDLFVNRQFWNALDYISRYRLVNQIGTVVREYRYNLRLVNQQQKCLAFYSCDFTSNPYQCRIDFDAKEVNGFELNDNNSP